MLYVLEAKTMNGVKYYVGENKYGNIISTSDFISAKTFKSRSEVDFIHSELRHGNYEVRVYSNEEAKELIQQ